jgi:hypothetical protein
MAPTVPSLDRVHPHPSHEPGTRDSPQRQLVHIQTQMLPSLRALTLSRVAATLVAVALSGAPALVRATTSAHNVCMCPSHGRRQQCECASRRASTHDAVRKPPCHAPRDGGDGSPASACCARISGGCGTPEAQLPPPRTVEAFTLPDAETIAGPDSGERITVTVSLPREEPRRPETPPPRPA